MCAGHTHEHAVLVDKTKVAANTFAAVNRSKAFSPVDGPAHLGGNTKEVHEARVRPVPTGQDHLVGKGGGIETQVVILEYQLNNNLILAFCCVDSVPSVF